MTLLFAARVALLLAAVFALVLARRDPAHRPVAAFLCGGALANAARIALQRLLILPAVIDAGGNPVRGLPPVAPIHGWARVAAHTDHSIQFAWSAGLVMAALWVFRKAESVRAVTLVRPDGEQLVIERRTIHGAPRWALIVPVIAWAGFATFFTATYPESRPLHRQGYLLADMLAIGTGLALCAAWLRRERPQRIGDAATCMLLILLLEGVSLLGPYLASNYFAGYNRAQIVYVVLYGLLSLLQGGRLWISR